MSFLNHARSTALVWASTALLCAGCAAAPTDTGDNDQATPGEETTGTVEQPFINYFWTLDNGSGWRWMVSYSFYYQRWIWNYCYGYNTSGTGWRVCYSGAPFNPGNPDVGINPSAPKVSGSPPARAPAGAPTAAPSTGGIPTVKPRGA